MFKNLQNKTNQLKYLYLGFGSLTAAFVLLALVATQQITQVHDELVDITQTNDWQLKNAMDMRVAVRERATLLWHMTLTDDIFDRDELMQEFLAYGNKFGIARTNLAESPLSPTESQLLAALDKETQKRAPELREFADLLMDDEGHSSYTARLDKSLSDQVVVADLIDVLIAHQSQENEDAREQNAQQVSTILTWLITGMVLIILLSVIFAKSVVRQAHVQIEKLKEAEKRLGEANDELRLLARHDHLTGLPNRLYLMEHLESSLALVRRHGQRGAVLYIDLDEFKPINDNHGHEAGDAYLIAISQRMREQLRETDLLARLGGDEFVVLLGDIAKNHEAIAVAEKLLDSLSQPVTLAPGLTVKGSASLGVCYLRQDAGKDAETVLGCADQAMYKAKSNGKNGFAVHSEDEQPLSVAR